MGIVQDSRSTDAHYDRRRQALELQAFIFSLFLYCVCAGGMIFATAGIVISDYLEQKFPATEQEKERAEALSPITVIDHDLNKKK